MARHALPSSLRAATLLLPVLLVLLALPGVPAAQHEEYEARAFESWLAGASCEELEDESLFLRASLFSRKQGVREWQMGLRLQLRSAHRRYVKRCLQERRYWSYECLSIQRTMGILRHALNDDELLSDTNAERRILTRRREKIEERRARVCDPGRARVIEEAP